MVSCDPWFLKLVLVSAFLVASTDARSWDIAVAIGQQIDLFAQNGTRMGQVKVANAKMLTGLAYDSVTGTMYMSDRKNENISIHGSNLNRRKSSDPYSVLNHTNGAQIMAIAFDSVDRNLFWTDAKNHTMMKMQVPLNDQNRAPNRPEVLHDLKTYNPYGIALDLCNRFIYWSSCEKVTVCSIERSKLDGTDREVVVNSALYDVYGLAIDHAAGKLYWVDDLEGDNYNIEYSNLDGTERALFLKGTHKEPTYVAVDDEAVYWTDRQSEAVWKIKKNKEIDDELIELKSYSPSNPHCHITSIITRDNIGDMDCPAILKKQKIRLENLACTYEEGPTGGFCKLSVCHNYCVHGSCVLDAEGSPRCVCGISYTGDRCERDVCDGYCLNDGTCSVSSAGPSCKCTENSQGSRCEYTTKLDELCSPYCRGTNAASA